MRQPIDADAIMAGARISISFEKVCLMTSLTKTLAAAGFLMLSAASAAFGAAADYEFQPVTPTVKGGDGSELAVRLIDKRTGKPVAGAVVFRTRLDMSPDSMGEMEAKHKPEASTEPGIYKFKADLTMAGGWALKLQAKVLGESETVEGTVVFQAKD
jgi:hypothetical protein